MVVFNNNVTRGKIQVTHEQLKNWQSDTKTSFLNNLKNIVDEKGNSLNYSTIEKNTGKKKNTPPYNSGDNSGCNS